MPLVVKVILNTLDLRCIQIENFANRNILISNQANASIHEIGVC
jgi:hypothetical protein